MATFPEAPLTAGAVPLVVVLGAMSDELTVQDVSDALAVPDGVPPPVVGVPHAASRTVETTTAPNAARAPRERIAELRSSRNPPHNHEDTSNGGHYASPC
ncbi:MAG: hypothetical protein ACRDHP_19940 [Ktedonobacterales bacterium]